MYLSAQSPSLSSTSFSDETTMTYAIEIWSLYYSIVSWQWFSTLRGGKLSHSKQKKRTACSGVKLKHPKYPVLSFASPSTGLWDSVSSSAFHWPLGGTWIILWSATAEWG